MQWGGFTRTGSHRGRGGALGWTLGLMAGVAVAQLALILSLQHRPAADSAVPPVPLAASVPHPNPQPPAPVAPLNAAGPGSGEPTAKTPRTADLVARPEGVPVPEPPRPVPAATDDPASLARDDVRALVADSIQLRRNGDMGGALAKLATAAEIQPGHPRILFEQAATYEAMSLTDKASAAFAQIVALGPARAGALHGIAERRLSEGLRTVQTAAPSDADLFVGDIREIRRPQTPGMQKVDLHIDLHARPGKKIIPADVFLFVQFFDLVNGSRVEPTRADPPQTRWTSSPVDWKDPAIETVEVGYSLSTPSSMGSGGEERREYLGYLVELYYQDALLDVVAQPRRLARFHVRSAPDSPPSAGRPASIDPLGGGLLEDAPPAPIQK